MAEDLRSLLASAPSADDGGGDNNLGFIGMPKNYVAQRPGRGYTPTPGGAADFRVAESGANQTQVAPPRYQQGAQMEPRSYSPEKIAQLQSALVGAGLIGADTRYRLGVWDSSSISGYTKLLSYANQGGLSREDALSELMANPAGKPSDIAGAGAAAPQFNTRLNTYESSDPASLRLTAEEAFQKALGRKPHKDEQERFVSAFLGKERGSQSAVFGANDRLDAAARRQALGGVGPAGGTSESDDLWTRLQQMAADAPGKIGLGSRSRDYATQVKLYNAYKNGTGPQAAKPGTSKHGDGRANDVTYENDATRAWVLANAGRYGLAAPLYNPNLARGRDESWHIELAHGVHQGLPTAGAAPAAAGQPPISTDVNVQRQDAGAQAVEFARAQNPTETAAYDIGQTFNNFTEILKRGVI